MFNSCTISDFSGSGGVFAYRLVRLAFNSPVLASGVQIYFRMFRHMIFGGQKCYILLISRLSNLIASIRQSKRLHGEEPHFRLGG